MYDNARAPTPAEDLWAEEEEAGAPPQRTAKRLVLVGVAVVLLIGVVLPLTVGLVHTSRPSRTFTYVIPAGTRARLDAGEEVSVLPAELVMRTQDYLVIVNEDSSSFSVGGVAAAAKQSVSFHYGKPGVYGGQCELHASDNVDIIVE